MNKRRKDMNVSAYQLEFLWFSYFGITHTKAVEEKSAAVKACIKRAYLDLNRSLVFTHSLSELDQMKKNEPKRTMSYSTQKECYYSYSGKKIEKQIDSLLKKVEITEEVFFEWHKTLCKALVDIAKECNKDGVDLYKPGGFTYGHAQKWVNMTLKYMLLMDLWDMSDLVEFLHVPIDNYILGVAFKNLEMRSIIQKNGDQYRIKEGNNSYPWSAIPNEGVYSSFRKKLEEEIISPTQKTPIEWECKAWIDAQNC